MPSPGPVERHATARGRGPSAPGQPPPAASSSLRTAVRLAAAAAALALALVPIARQRALAARQEQMTAWLTLSGVQPPREIEHEPDPGRVDLRAARASLAAELDPARRSDLPPAEEARQRTEGSARMEATAHMAGDALAERPAAWEAAMVMGAATYLSWSQARDPRLFTAAPAWERPLETAVALAPGRDEAARLLAAAYLELWPVLSPAKRDRERRLLAGVFADPVAFASLIGPWLVTAANREEAFAIVPQTPEAWAKLQQIYAQQADWPGFCEARGRWDLALQANLSSRLATAEERRASSEARGQFLEVAIEARPGRRYLGLLGRALEGCPPGSVDHHTGELLEKHLVWALERCRLDRCPLSPRALRRLAGFCRDLDPRIDAMAALVTDDLPRAEVLERNYATDWSEDWAAYRLLKAKLLTERGDRSQRGEHGERGDPPDRSEPGGRTQPASQAERAARAEHAPEIAAAFALIPRSWQERPSYWQVRAAAARETADTAAEAVAARELARLTASEWPATAWHFHDGLPRLELLTAAGAPGLELRIDEAPPRGAAAEIRLDESILGTFPVTAGTVLVLRTPVAPGLHLLEIESVAGGTVLPGALRLARADGDGPGGGTAAVGGVRSGGEPR
jgi:hypothetical protein